MKTAQQLVSDVNAYLASVTAAAPIKQASPLQKSALVSAGTALISEIDAALAGAVGDLDAGDPTGFPGSFPGYLEGLGNSSGDQAILAELRGTLGRAVFNLGQA